MDDTQFVVPESSGSDFSLLPQRQEHTSRVAFKWDFPGPSFTFLELPAQPWFRVTSHALGCSLSFYLNRMSDPAKPVLAVHLPSAGQWALVVHGEDGIHARVDRKGCFGTSEVNPPDVSRQKYDLLNTDDLPVVHDFHVKGGVCLRGLDSQVGWLSDLLAFVESHFDIGNRPVGYSTDVAGQVAGMLDGVDGLMELLEAMRDQWVVDASPGARNADARQEERDTQPEPEPEPVDVRPYRKDAEELRKLASWLHAEGSQLAGLDYLVKLADRLDPSSETAARLADELLAELGELDDWRVIAETAVRALFTREQPATVRALMR